ncbi:cytochrome c oxidase assembly protein [Bacillus mesophilum]|uniref:Cytochrome c oxidase assembly protein n=1 Tax=Bacillus mesophilum TaxID=1071718 RepID=A0A7V7RQJ5_9BACI|nr:cytochrome c oxidase assembly protein [Bacillus mesophilum]KAB2335668.1 cytochrome c oxidase assembly protein [Bacillus mesophilum]
MNILNHIHHSEAAHIEHTVGILPQLLLALPFVLGLVLYILAVVVSSKKDKPWPIYRPVCWILGVFFAVISVAGPLAIRAHTDFTAHMFGHLLLGMLAPLLMAMAAPVTLILRTLSVPLARSFSKLLKSWPSRMVTNPVIASLLNVGGLWILYTTDLYSLMHKNILMHLIIHFHVFAAGYLFTISMIYIDPIFHRTSFIYRAVVFVAALAGHGILSKFIYGNPPNGVPADQAELGGMVMFYGGDIIDVMIIYILCMQWFKSARPRIKIAINQ